MPSPKKTNSAEVAKRTNQVLKWLIRGKDRQYILQNAAKWDIAPRTIDEYISKANKELTRCAKIKNERELGRAIKRLNDLYDQAYQRSDYKLCLGVQKELSELLGLKIEKIDLKSDNTFRIQVVREVNDRIENEND